MRLRWITEKSSTYTRSQHRFFFSLVRKRGRYVIRMCQPGEDRSNGRQTNYKLIIYRARIYFLRLSDTLRQLFKSDDSSFRVFHLTRVFIKRLKRGNRSNRTKGFVGDCIEWTSIFKTKSYIVANERGLLMQYIVGSYCTSWNHWTVGCSKTKSSNISKWTHTGHASSYTLQEK